MRWTKGKYAFIGATHTDHQHIHKPTRLRATVGEDFDPEDIRVVIAGTRPIPTLPKEAPSSQAPPRRVNLIIDIQARL